MWSGRNTCESTTAGCRSEIERVIAREPGAPAHVWGKCRW